MNRDVPGAFAACLLLLIGGCSTSGSTNPGAPPCTSCGDAEAAADGGLDEPPLPDGVTELSSEVPFPRDLHPYAYTKLAVGDDGSLAVAATTTNEVVIASYGPGLRRRFAIATPEVMDDAEVRGLFIRSDGNVVVAWGERDTRKNEGSVVTFRSDGTALHPIVAVDMAAFAFGLDAQDRILFGTVAGVDQNATTKSVVKRLLPDGQPDPSFGTAGAATFTCDGPTAHPGGNLVALSDGSVLALVSGYRPTGSGIYVAKLTPAGVLDPKFGQGGCASVPGFESRSLYVDESGAIWLLGTWKYNSALLKLRPDGSVDSAFGTRGLREVVPASGVGSIPRGVQRAGSGILLLEQKSRAAGGSQFDLLRINGPTPISGEPVLDDSGYLDFKIKKGNLYFTTAKYAGRTAIP